MNLQLGQILPYLFSFGLILVRCSGTFVMVPMLGGEILPLRLRGAVATVMALTLTPLAGPLAVTSTVELLLAVVGEFLMGLAMGLVLRLVLVSAELAGEAAGMQMGFAFSRIVDPLSPEPAAVTARLFGSVATLLLLAIDGHHMMLSGLEASLHQAPVGTVLPRALYVATLVPLLSAVTTAGLRIAAPVIVAVLLTNAAIGLLARAAPQLNLFIFAFGLSIGIGMLMFSSSVTPTVSLLVQQLRQIGTHLAAVIGG